MRLIEEESGQTLIVTAVFMSLIAIGFLAFAIDVGTLFRQKRLAQSAADAVALAAASEVAAGNAANEQTAANAVAMLNGFDTTLAANPASVQLAAVNSGTFSGAIQATVSMPVHTVFLGAFSSKMSSVPVSAQAVAGGQASQTCVCLEGTSGQTLNMSNGTSLTAPGCGVVDNSSSSNAIGIVGGSALSSLSLGTVSTNWNNPSNINNGGSIASSTRVFQGISNKCSPPMPVIPAYSNCLADPGGSYLSFTAGPPNSSGTVCYKSLTVGANGSLPTLNPGTYVITEGALHFEYGSGGHSNLGGNGVFFYLTGTASLLVDNGANVNLVAGGNTLASGGTAPTVGVYNGITVYQDTSDTAAISLQGGSSSYLNGAIYAPAATLNVGNGSGARMSGGIVANSLTLTGGGILNATAGTNQGSLAIGSARLLQ